MRRPRVSVCGVWGWVGAGPMGRSPQRLVWGQEQGLGSEHPADGPQSGRRPGEGSFLAAAALGGPGLGSVFAKAQGEAGMWESFSPLAAVNPSDPSELPPTAPFADSEDPGAGAEARAPPEAKARPPEAGGTPATAASELQATPSLHQQLCREGDAPKRRFRPL